jgi:peptidoglycan/xylan/chitin deacetylase (PgdA/CDA1 family)
MNADHHTQPTSHQAAKFFVPWCLGGSFQPPIWGVVAAAAAGIGAGMAYAVAAPSAQVFGPALVRGRRDDCRLALTFDDGPSESTPALLDVLARHSAGATFFFCGANVARLPGVARRAASEGHEIGNHTYTHPRLFILGSAAIELEISRTQQVIRETIGQTPRLFRPPYGIRWFGLYPALRKHGLTAVMWSACAYDWKRPAEVIESALRAKAAGGIIVLLHDGDKTTPGDRRLATVRALDRVLPALRDRGLRCVTVSELFQDR